MRERKSSRRITEQLVLKYLHKDLSDSEAAELNRRIEEDPKTVKLLLKTADEEILLNQALQQSEEKQNILSMFSIRATAAALVIAGVLTFLLVFRHKESAPDSLILTLERFRPLITVYRDSKPKQSLRKLRAGDRIQTGENGLARLSYEDKSVLTLNSNSDLTITRMEPSKSIQLNQGNIFINAMPQKTPMKIHHNQLSVNILGTGIDIRDAGGGTGISLFEGTIRTETHSSAVKVSGPVHFKCKSGSNGTLNVIFGPAPLKQFAWLASPVTGMDRFSRNLTLASAFIKQPSLSYMLIKNGTWSFDVNDKGLIIDKTDLNEGMLEFYGRQWIKGTVRCEVMIKKIHPEKKPRVGFSFGFPQTNAYHVTSLLRRKYITSYPSGNSPWFTMMIDFKSTGKNGINFYSPRLKRTGAREWIKKAKSYNKKHGIGPCTFGLLCWNCKATFRNITISKSVPARDKRP